MSKKFYLTRKGILALHQKRRELMADLEASTRAMGHSASVDNDLRENPEFMQLRTKISYELPRKIAEVREILDSRILIEDMEEHRSGRYVEIIPGVQVDLVSEDGENRSLSIMGYGESDPYGDIVSYLSPIGEALIQKEEGDEVHLMWNGQRVLYEIIGIARSPHLD